MNRLLILLPWSVALFCSSARSQSGELDPDESTVVEATEDEESQDRLRVARIDLTRAGLAELLSIPGLSRRDAMLIVRAVRSGRIAEVRDIDLVPGIKPGTAAFVAPYVLIERDGGIVLPHGRVRAVARFRDKQGRFVVEGARRQVLLTTDNHNTWSGDSQFEMRATGTDGSPPIAFLKTSLLDGAVTVSVGTLRWRLGSPMLDAARTTGLFRPSEWERALVFPATTRIGTDEATAGRGATVSFMTETHQGIIGTTVMPEGQIVTALAISEALSEDLRVNCALRSAPRAFAVGMTADGAMTTGRWETAFAQSGAWAGVGYGRWAPSRDLLAQVIIRHDRGVSAGAIPRQGGTRTDEDGGSLAVSGRLSGLWRYQLVLDVARLRSREEPDRVWGAARGGSCMTSVSLDGGHQVASEWAWDHRPRSDMRRVTMEWVQRPLKYVEWRSTISIKTETESAGTRETGRLMRIQAAWKEEPVGVVLRWTIVQGSRSVAFWNSGPGPSALGMLTVLAGPCSLVQFGVQGRWKEKLLLSMVSNHYLVAPESRREDSGVSASILLEFLL